MSDETKGATVMVQGCRHDNVTAMDGSNVGECDECPVLVSMTNWRKLHPPPEPPKSWVRRKAEATGRDSDYAERLMRETVEECCRFLQGYESRNLAERLRRAMLEPKP